MGTCYFKSGRWDVCSMWQLFLWAFWISTRICHRNIRALPVYHVKNYNISESVFSILRNNCDIQYEFDLLICFFNAQRVTSFLTLNDRIYQNLIVSTDIVWKLRYQDKLPKNRILRKAVPPFKNQMATYVLLLTDIPPFLKSWQYVGGLIIGPQSPNHSTKHYV